MKEERGRENMLLDLWLLNLVEYHFNVQLIVVVFSICSMRTSEDFK